MIILDCGYQNHRRLHTINNLQQRTEVDICATIERLAAVTQACELKVMVAGEVLREQWPKPEAEQYSVTTASQRARQTDLAPVSRKEDSFFKKSVLMRRNPTL